MITLIRNMFYAGALSVASLPVLYQVAPTAYGHLAFAFGLPITQKIKEAVPGEWLDFQYERLERGEAAAKKNRTDLNRQRGQIRDAIAANAQPRAATAYWLGQAKEEFKKVPSSPHYALAGKTYSAAEFGQQVLMLQNQLKAYDAADEKLRASEASLTELERKLVASASTLESSRVRLKAARLALDSQELISDFEIEIPEVELGEELQASEFLLRSGVELARDAALAGNAQSAPQVGPGTAISPEAMAILNQP